MGDSAMGPELTPIAPIRVARTDRTDPCRS